MGDPASPLNPVLASPIRGSNSNSLSGDLEVAVRVCACCIIMDKLWQVSQKKCDYFQIIFDRCMLWVQWTDAGVEGSERSVRWKLADLVHSVAVRSCCWHFQVELSLRERNSASK